MPEFGFLNEGDDYMAAKVPARKTLGALLTVLGLITFLLGAWITTQALIEAANGSAAANGTETLNYNRN
jgi:hypothetical protein